MAIACLYEHGIELVGTKAALADSIVAPKVFSSCHANGDALVDLGNSESV